MAEHRGGVVNKILFLDIDGVLNGHERHANGYCGINPERLRLLDHIVEQTDCRIVLASAWRYMILGGDMTLKGFGYLLSIMGAGKKTADALLDYLPRDSYHADPHDRGNLAKRWVDEQYRIVAMAVGLDDLEDPGYTANGIAFVRTDPAVGLTADTANEAIRILNTSGGNFSS